MGKTKFIAIIGSLTMIMSVLVGDYAQGQGPPTLPFEVQHDAIQSQVTTEHGDLQAEFSAQHALIQDDIADLNDAMATLQETVEQLEVGPGPPCGPGTVGQRFVVSPSGLTACDNTTGFIWERTPDNSLLGQVDAIAHCTGKQVGGLDGWSLPTLKQWFSLIDYSQPGPLPRSSDLRALPLGHPFPIGQSPPENNVQVFYWSSTPFTETPTTQAWNVRLDDGRSQFGGKSDELFVWCVHDGQS